MSTVIKSGKFSGSALTLNFLLFFDKTPPCNLTPGALPSNLTGIIIVTSLSSKS